MTAKSAKSAKSDTSSPESLFDLALGCCALNFERVFLDRNTHYQFSVKKEIVLPPRCFEAILDKGRATNTFPALDLLRPCFGQRERLQWNRINLSRPLFSYGHKWKFWNDELTVRDLEDMTRGDAAPLRELVYCSGGMTETELRQLASFAPGLESLSLGCHLVGTDLWSTTWALAPKTWSGEDSFIRFERLRRLQLYFVDVPMAFFTKLDLSSATSHLEVLKLNSFNARVDCESTRRSVDSYSSLLVGAIERCSRLKHLELVDCYVSGVSELFGALQRLPDVASICIQQLWSEYDRPDFELDLSRLVAGWPKLETLSVQGRLYSKKRVDDYFDWRIMHIGEGLRRDDEVLILYARAWRNLKKGEDFTFDVSSNSVATFGRPKTGDFESWIF